MLDINIFLHMIAFSRNDKKLRPAKVNILLNILEKAISTKIQIHNIYLFFWLFKSYRETISFLSTQPFSVLAFDIWALFIWKQNDKQNPVFICLLSSNILLFNWLKFYILSGMLFLRQTWIVLLGWFFYVSFFNMHFLMGVNLSLQIMM